jgi:DNA/RNA-binding domain of Phe-tRNA-synthetase-like protein
MQDMQSKQPMRLTIGSDVLAPNPGMRILATAVRGIDNRTENPEIEALLAESWRAMGELAARYGSAQQHPLVAPWRDALRAMGVNGKKFPCAIESMVRRAFKSPEPVRLNPLTDFLHAMSLRHTVPLGAFDAADTGGGQIDLRRTDDKDTFQALDSDETVAVEPGEVAYAWQEHVLTRHFVWRQAARALIKPETTDAVIVVELLPQLDEPATEAFAADLAEGLAKHFGGAAPLRILGTDDTTAELDG